MICPRLGREAVGCQCCPVGSCLVGITCLHSDPSLLLEHPQGKIHAPHLQTGHCTGASPVLTPGAGGSGDPKAQRQH